MEYEQQLTFLQQLLKGLNIASCVLTSPGKSIPPRIDLGLRSELFGLSDYSSFLQNSMEEARDNTIYRFFDEYDCNYIFLKLPEEDGYFFVGPYLLSVPAEEQIQKKAAVLALTPGQIRQMQLYYSGLPLVEDENLLLTMVNTFACHLWGSPEGYSMEYVNYAIPDRYEPIPFSPTPTAKPEMLLSLSTLEENYANENLLMEAVSKGKLQLITAVASTVYNNGATPRLSDSLRDRKNNLVILKTLLDARLGGVQLLLGHLAHFLVFLRSEDFAGFFHVGFQRLVFLECHDDRLQVLIVLVQLHELLHVGSHSRVGELFAHFLPAVLYRFEF